MNKRWGKSLIAVLCAAVLLVLPCTEAYAALFAFETQFDHEKADIAWLTDLVVKEDMSSVDGLAQRCELQVKPEYPYTDTPESFAEDVAHYCSLYNLEQSSPRAAYIYFFDVLSAQAGSLAAGEISDDDIRIYLESVGIVYPDELSSDELIVARALYSAMASGAFSGITSGSSLEEVMVTYLASLSGVNIEQLKEWLPDASVLSLDAYILAASKLALWTNGYDVSEETDEDEVFRLVAHMTIDQLGISADSTLPFEELKARYTAVMIGKKYGVRVDSAKLAACIENDTAAFYILQLLGKDAGLSLREDNCTFEEAFELVAENTDLFKLENDEFYADIYNYDLRLKYRRSSIWVYPTAYVSGDDYVISMDIDGFDIRNRYYTEVPVDPDKAEQTLALTVFVKSDKKESKCVYYITLHQGTQEAKPNVPVKPQEGTLTDLDPFISSESLVAQIMTSLGVEASAADALTGSLLTLTAPFAGVMSYIAPTFDLDTTGLTAGLTETAGNTVLSDDQYKTVLDEIGNLSDVAIRGIDGTGLNAKNTVSFDLRDYITFE